jgi:arylsulfatase A-like enzyme
MRKILIATVLLVITSALMPNCMAGNKKNVLFIAIDDLKPILGCYGNELVQTPNIDKLASEGIVFENNHCQQAVCAPSRASLMTGMRPDITKVWDLKTLIRDKNPDILTMPQYFKQNGYFATGVGKIYDKRSVDNQHDKVSWSEKFEFEGDDKYYAPNYGHPALHYYQKPETKKLAEKYLKEAEDKGLKGYDITKYALGYVKPSTECADVPDNAYVDGVIALSAISRLQKLSKSSKPFFLGVGFKRPHLPFAAPKKYWELYERDEMPLAPYQKASVNGPKMAYHNSGELRSYSDIPPLKSFSDIKSDLIPEDKQREMIHGYYAAVSYIDAMVGKVIAALDSLGLRENTVIVLWGDHGWHLGDHGIWCKHTNFEQATRSPLIFTAPEIKIRKSSVPVEFIDIFPTLCDLAGVKKPDHLEGISLLPIINGKQKQVKDFAVSQFQRGKNMGYAFRTERYRYVVWLKNKYRSNMPYREDLILAQELYDYEVDPLETRNVLGDKKYKDIAKKMIGLSEEFFKSKLRN